MTGSTPKCGTCALRRTLVAESATRRVTFVAHSCGTILAAHYAAGHPEEVERLVLHGRSDPVTPLARNEERAASIDPRLLVTDDDHASYPRRSARVIAASVLD